MNLNDDIKFLLNTINKSGFESFVVGGCVRDSIMNITPKDFDITTSALPEQIKTLFDKTIDTGIQHGTVTVVVNKENYEVTTYRIDGEYENNRKPTEVFFTEDIVKDLERRDFTMNAIAYNEEKGYVDPFGGQDDINNKLIRGVGNPRVRFCEDALRMFRAVRFSVQLGFDIDKDTYDAILLENKLVKSLSVERVREEFSKLLLGSFLDKANLIVDTKLFYYYNEPFHNYLLQNLDDKIEKIKKTSLNLVIRYAVLLQDLSANDAKAFLKFLKFDNNTINKVFNIINCNNEIDLNCNDVFTRKLISKYGYECVEDCLYIQKVCNNKNTDNISNYLNQSKINNYPTKIKDLNINGNDLKILGVTKGVEIGNILNELLEKSLENPYLNNKEDLTSLSQSIINQTSYS